MSVFSGLVVSEPALRSDPAAFEALALKFSTIGTGVATSAGSYQRYGAGDLEGLRDDGRGKFDEAKGSIVQLGDELDWLGDESDAISQVFTTHSDALDELKTQSDNLLTLARDVQLPEAEDADRDRRFRQGQAAAAWRQLQDTPVDSDLYPEAERVVERTRTASSAASMRHFRAIEALERSQTEFDQLREDENALNEGLVTTVGGFELPVPEYTLGDPGFLSTFHRDAADYYFDQGNFSMAQFHWDQIPDREPVVADTALDVVRDWMEANDYDTVTQTQIAEAIEQGELHPEVAEALGYLDDNPDYFTLAATTADISSTNYSIPTTQSLSIADIDEAIDITEEIREQVANGDRSNDVVAGAVNWHAFVGDPDAAYDFITSLPTSFDDLSGNSSGYPIGDFNDEALRATAASALEGADSFVEQTMVVAHMPESDGAVRNLLITAYYAEIAERANERLNGGFGDPLDPTIDGHSGTHWAMFAPHASNSVRPAITGDVSAFGFSPTDRDRQNAADGNQYIFGTIGPAYAAWLEAFPEGGDIDEETVQEFFTDYRLPGEDTPMFRPGMGDLRDGFVRYTAALNEDDQAARQELVFTGNLQLATFEQAGAHQYIEDLTDLDGWRAPLQIFTPFLGGDEVIATEFIDLTVGIDGDTTTLDVNRDLENRPGINSDVLGVPLAEFDPLQQNVDFGDFEVSLGGMSSGLSLSGLSGWDLPPDNSDMESFSVTPAEWAEGGDGNFISTAGGVVFEGSGSGDGIDLDGTGATNWSDWEERQWYIANLFQQMHTDPDMFAHLDDYAPGRSDVEPGEQMPDFLPDNALAELGG